MSNRKFPGGFGDSKARGFCFVVIPIEGSATGVAAWAGSFVKGCDDGLECGQQVGSGGDKFAVGAQFMF